MRFRFSSDGIFLVILLSLLEKTDWSQVRFLINLGLSSARSEVWRCFDVRKSYVTLHLQKSKRLLKVNTGNLTRYSQVILRSQSVSYYSNLVSGSQSWCSTGTQLWLQYQRVIEGYRYIWMRDWESDIRISWYKRVILGYQTKGEWYQDSLCRAILYLPSDGGCA